MADEYIYIISGEEGPEDGGYWAYLEPEKAAQYISEDGPNTNLRVIRYKISEPTEVTFKTEIVEVPAPWKADPGRGDRSQEETY